LNSMTHDLRTARGFSVMEMLIVVSIILILAAIEIPNLFRARMAANQAAAVASVRAIEAAEATYSLTYNHGYSSGLSDLGPPAGSPSPKGADLIDDLLAKGGKGGYSFVYIPGPVVDGRIDTYTLKAVPSEPCSSGTEYYTVEPSNPTTILSQNFHVAPQEDIIAEVLVGSMSRAKSACE
jgi:type IV pilus assembly protein PilA